MMNEELTWLYQQTSMRQPLEEKLNELRRQRMLYHDQVISARIAYRKEQEDVDKLEGRSLANYFFRVVGTMEDKLTRERQEACAAKVKLEAAERELAGVEADIHALTDQLNAVRLAEEQYRAAKARKAATLKESGTSAGAQILELEQRLTELENLKREIREAYSAGCGARSLAERVLSELNDADNWNTWDLIGGGGLITHMAKHSHLDEAQDLVQELQSKLRRFKTELADVRISGDLQVNVEGFLRFADYFFDGLFADWAVGKHISRSYDSVQSTKTQIERALKKLDDLQSVTQQQIENTKQELDRLIVQA